MPLAICGKGHEFSHNTKPGNSTRCTYVLPDGSKCAANTYVRRAAAKVSGPGSELTALWAAEPELAAPDDWTLTVAPREGSCGECAEPLFWSPRGTMLYCESCGTAGVQPGRVRDRAAVRLAVEADQAAKRSAAVATRESPEQAMLARLAAAEQADKSMATVDGWLDFLDPEYLDDDSPLFDFAQKLCRHLSHMRKELAKAEPGPELDAARGIVSRLCKLAKELEPEIIQEHRRLRDEARQAQEEQERLALERQTVERERQSWQMQAEPEIVDAEIVYEDPGGGWASGGAALVPWQPGNAVAVRDPGQAVLQARRDTAARLQAASEARQARIEQYGRCPFRDNHGFLWAKVIGGDTPAVEYAYAGAAKQAWAVAGQVDPAAPVIVTCGSAECEQSAAATIGAQGYSEFVKWELQ